MLDVPLTDTYHDVEPLLHYFCDRFCQKFQYQDREELMSQVNGAFWRAYVTHKKEQSRFSTYLTRCVHNKLHTFRRNQLRQKRFYRREDLHSNIPELQVFDVFQLLQELSEDARTVIQLSLDFVPDPEVRWRSLVKQQRVYLQEMLRLLKWNKVRIRQAFLEVREALA